MSDYRRRGLRSSQRSARFWTEQCDEDPRLRKRIDYYRLSHTHMLIRDVSNTVLPVPGYSNKKYEVRLTPADASAERLIREAIGERRPRGTLTDAAYDFFQQCAATVMAFGSGHYEVVYLSNADGKVVAFSLEPIQPLTVVLRRGRLYQYVPSTTGSGNTASHYIELDGETVLTVDLPDHVRLSYKHMMESLAFLSINSVPSFVRADMSSQTNSSFVFREFNSTQTRAIAQSTREIGWSARGLFRKETLEYYFFHRHLIFEKFKCEMRMCILDRLNSAIKAAGVRVGFEGRLEIAGLPTLAEIEASQERLSAGGSPFEDVMKPYIYS